MKSGPMPPVTVKFDPDSLRHQDDATTTRRKELPLPKPTGSDLIDDDPRMDDLLV